MPRAARRPAPSARITVAPPVTMSPPANTPGMLVACDTGSATMLPHLLSFSSGVVWPMIGFACVPIA